MPKSSEAPQRAIVYCVIPEDLAGRLHEPLRKHFRNDASVDVIVEQRGQDRRSSDDRRGAGSATWEPADDERRRIRALQGRRVSDRRAPVVFVDPPSTLGRKARAHVDRILFVERLEPSTQRLEDVDTARMVARIQAGARDEFADLYMRYFDRVYSYMIVILRSQHAAEDATQHVFMQVLENISRYERREQPFRAWLFRIARNWAIRELEKSSRIELVDSVEPPEPLGHDGDPAIADWMSDRDLVLFVERLPLAQRQVLVLRFMLDLSTADIATILERSEDDIRALQSRALRFLRARLTSVGRAPAGRTQRQPIGRRKDHATVLRSRRFALTGR